jgi:hypothetical protein
MFHQDAVPQALHSLLGKVLSIEGLENFFLGGGTSLAYRLGYRSSIDIDLFCDSVFDTQACLDALESVFPGFALLNRTKGSLCVAIDGIKRISSFTNILSWPRPRNPTESGCSRWKTWRR